MKKYLWVFLSLLLLACNPGKDQDPDSGGDLIVIPLWPPENVYLHSATKTSLTFQWNTVMGATSYGWLLMDKKYETLKEGVVTQRHVEVTGLKPGTSYLFSVRCQAKDEIFEYSSPIEATTLEKEADPAVDALCVDAPLVLEFESAPVLGTSGLIKVFKSESAEEVDRINLADIATVNVRDDGVMLPKEQITSATERNSFMDVLSSGGRTRTVHYTPLQVKGNTLVVKLHSGVLDFDTEYYLTMDESVCGKAVGAGEYKFTTASSPSTSAIRVAADGSGDFCTLQRALTHAGPGATITLANGTYPELLYLREKKNITVKGDSRSGVRIAYPNSEICMNGSSARCMWLVENCDNLVLENLTIENTYGAQGQAETIYFNSGSNAHKLIIENCSLHSLQDTFLCKGEVYVHNSLIAGNVDFIWGYPKACLFEDCEIRCEKYSSGFIIQARVPSASMKGFVFLNCNITGGEGAKDGSIYLARSAGQADCFDNVVFVNCTMGSVINPAGWYTNPAPNPTTPTAASGWREYGSKTPSGAAVTGHNTYGLVLSAAEAEAYSTKAAVLGW